MLLLIAALTLFIVFVLCKVKFSRRHAAFATFPRPPGIPFFHNLFLFLKESSNLQEAATKKQSELHFSIVESRLWLIQLWQKQCHSINQIGLDLCFMNLLLSGLVKMDTFCHH
jgi:hypothetical protein